MRRYSIFFDLLLFVATIFLASYNAWSVTDLVWSLWISSLLLGYTFLLVPIASMMIRGNPGPMISGNKKIFKDKNVAPALQAIPMNFFLMVVSLFIFGISWITFWVIVVAGLSALLGIGGMLRERPGWQWAPDPNDFFARILILFPTALFFLGFFTIHFVGFHFIHSIFLNGFFPILKDSPFGKTPDQTLGYLLTLTAMALRSYWPFVAISAVSRIPDYISAWRGTEKNMMFRPYLNVIRMHLMIFVFAFASAAGLKEMMLYPLLILYFFPFRALMKKRREDSLNP